MARTSSPREPRKSERVPDASATGFGTGAAGSDAGAGCGTGDALGFAAAAQVKLPCGHSALEGV